MKTRQSTATLEQIPVTCDEPIDVVELPGPISRATGAGVMESGTYTCTSALPKAYDELPNEPSTATNETLVQYAKLSNGKSVPRVVRRPRSSEPLEVRALHLLGFIDSKTSLGTIFERAGMSEGEAVVVLAKLVSLGILAID